jgi:dipeptidase E
MPGASEVRVAFGGGGDADDERAVLEAFSSWVGNGRLVYVPIALDSPHEPHLAWATAALGSVGITSIEMAASADQLRDALSRADGVFIGGGNAYVLLHSLRNAGVDRLLREYTERGRPMYGGSAGAIALGRDIGTARHADPDVLGLTDTSGLDLALGYAVWCHYVASDDARIRDYVNETGHAVLAIPERGGLVRTAERIEVVGPDSARLFATWSDRSLEPGDLVPVIA